MIEAKMLGIVTDAGQYVKGMRIDFGKEIAKEVDFDTFTVTMTSTVDYGILKGEPYPYYRADRPLEVVKTITNGSKVTVMFRQDQAGTLNWLSEGRNCPAVLHFEVVQNKPVLLKTVTPDSRILLSEEMFVIECRAESWKDLEDEEAEQFESVLVENGVNYQIHKGTNGKLLVWFHGNGEGDFEADGVGKQSGNNAAQILANRGGVAWVSAEAKEVFGDATIAAFQAPAVWYYATRNEHALLKLIRLEIDEIMEQNAIDPEEVYVAGCSAGGFMTTRMIIEYPDLFKSAMISCPALDIANLRSGLTDAVPSDEELAALRKAKTAIWLVQGKTDSVVETEECASRIWNILVQDRTVIFGEYPGKDGIASGFTTYETTDGRYRLSLYDTVDVKEITSNLGKQRTGGMLVFAEDYDLDGVSEPVKYSDHWSWIYTLRNDPVSKDGTHIWQWAVNPAGSKTDGEETLQMLEEEETAQSDETEREPMTFKDYGILVLAAAAGLAAGVLVGKLFTKKKG